jgi:hypothetical protein
VEGVERGACWRHWLACSLHRSEGEGWAQGATRSCCARFVAAKVRHALTHCKTGARSKLWVHGRVGGERRIHTLNKTEWRASGLVDFMARQVGSAKREGKVWHR